MCFLEYFQMHAKYSHPPHPQKTNKETTVCTTLEIREIYTLKDMSTLIVHPHIVQDIVSPE